jgi:hypothetical protein
VAATPLLPLLPRRNTGSSRELPQLGHLFTQLLLQQQDNGPARRRLRVLDVPFHSLRLLLAMVALEGRPALERDFVDWRDCRYDGILNLHPGQDQMPFLVGAWAGCSGQRRPPVQGHQTVPSQLTVQAVIAASHYLELARADMSATR